MSRVYRAVRYRRLRMLATCALACVASSATLAAEGANQVVAQAGNPPATGQMDDRAILLQRLQQFEQRLNQLEGLVKIGQPSIKIFMNRAGFDLPEVRAVHG